MSAFEKSKILKNFQENEKNACILLDLWYTISRAKCSRKGELKMKIKIGEFEVEVKAKGIVSSEKYNERDTQFFLNELSVVYREAAMFQEGQGRQAIARNYNTKSKDLYTKLLEMGVYNKKAE